MGAPKSIIKAIPLSDITVPERLREVDESYARTLAVSIKAHGLITPISVRATPNGKRKFTLVVGATRRRAVEIAEESVIDALVIKADADEAVLIEIAENLIRNDLSVMDRAVFVQTYRDIWERTRGKIRRGNPQLGQLDPINASPIDAVAMEAASGFSASCAERMGISEAAVKRLNRIAQNLPREVRQAISGTPIADNQSQLLKLAKLEPAKRAKAHIAIKEMDGDFKAAIALLDPPPAARQDPQNQFLSRLIDTWERANPETRQQFLEYAGLIDAPEGDEA